MEYRYRHLADNEIEPRVETLGLLARDVSDLMLGSKPPLTWITESASGFITWPHPIAGYTSTRGDIFVCADLSPHEIADTIAHECRHSWQKKQPKRLSPGARERDARIFALEFWNGRERTAGDSWRSPTHCSIEKSNCTRPRRPRKQSHPAQRNRMTFAGGLPLLSKPDPLRSSVS
jgi:hypothetical protein